MQLNRNYPLLLGSQFLSAFGDNAILAVILGQLTLLQKNGLITEETLRQRNIIYTSLLFVPYILLAPLAGYLNDRHRKSSWLTGGNLIKLLGAAICGLSIWFGYAWQAPGYFIVGIGACFYGPAKYGILPEILPSENLVKANGMVELLTLLAIIMGSIGGAFLIDRFSLFTCYAALLGVFGLSLALNLFMKATPNHPEVVLKESVGGFFAHLTELLRGPRLSRMLIGTALFWVAGAAMKMNFQPWGLKVLGLSSNLQVSLLGLWLSIGVMVGSLLAGQIHRVGELGWTRVYGFAMTVTLVLLGSVGVFPGWKSMIVTVGPLTLIMPVVFILILTGIAAGLFLIPLNAGLQAESHPGKLGKTIAVQNFGDNLGMVLAAILVSTCVAFKASANQVFIVLSLLVALVVFALRFPEKPQAR